MGWVLWKMLPPPVRIRVPAGAAFIPQSTQPVEAIVADFDRLQEEQLSWVARVRARDARVLGPGAGKAARQSLIHTLASRGGNTALSAPPATVTTSPAG